VQQHQGQSAGQFTVAALCRAMQVSPKGYYAWKGRPQSQRAQRDATLLECIRTAYKQSRHTYGSPRIYHELRAQDVWCGRHRVARLMRADGLGACLPKRFAATTDSRHALPVAPNILNRQFGAERTDAKWAGDITYIWTGEGWLYLAVVLDLFSRRVVGASTPACAGPCERRWRGN